MRDGDVLNVEIMARRQDWMDGVAVYMRQRIVGVKELVAAPVSMVERPADSMVEPMLRMSIHTAQQLMDELWQCGLRPTEGTGSAGSLAATERHLEDMRKLVAKLMAGKRLDKPEFDGILPFKGQNSP